jgi:predicted RNase H-like nuclease (RuvC/YqgF family)
MGNFFRSKVNDVNERRSQRNDSDEEHDNHGRYDDSDSEDIYYEAWQYGLTEDEQTQQKIRNLESRIQFYERIINKKNNTIEALREENNQLKYENDGLSRNAAKYVHKCLKNDKITSWIRM